MKKIIANVSIRILLGFWFIVSFFVFGNISALKAEDALTLDGSIYVNQREWPTIKAEYELDIRGATLVWRMRFTWAASDVVLPRPPGAWVELGQAQIVGREAHIYIQNPEPDNVVFTISEDGNSITGEEKAGTYMFYRTVPKSPTLAYPVPNTTVSEPVNKASSAIAQIESRGEFYFLTKDGRKLTGEEANKVPLEEGSKVVTGSTGHIKMILPDNTTFTVGPNSYLVIDKFVYDPATDSRAITANWNVGRGVRSCNSTLKEIADHLDFHYATISRAIKRGERV